MEPRITSHERMVEHLKAGVTALGSHNETLQGLVGSYLERRDDASVASEGGASDEVS